jgi:hypothetical protein
MSKTKSQEFVLRPSCCRYSFSSMCCQKKNILAARTESVAYEEEKQRTHEMKPENSRTRGRRTWRRRLTQSTTQWNRARGDAELDKARPPARLRDEAKGGAYGIRRERPPLPWLSKDLSQTVTRKPSPSEEEPRREAAHSRKNSEPATLTPLSEKRQQKKIEPPSRTATAQGGAHETESNSGPLSGEETRD